MPSSTPSTGLTTRRTSWAEPRSSTTRAVYRSKTHSLPQCPVSKFPVQLKGSWGSRPLNRSVINSAWVVSRNEKSPGRQCETDIDVGYSGWGPFLGDYNEINI